MYLIDTHVLLWHLQDAAQLPKWISELLEHERENVVVSDISFWELAIKISAGKLAIQQSLWEIRRNLEKHSVNLLTLDFSHIVQSQSLPFIHKDPFDRMLIAQAMVEKLTIVSKDHFFQYYEVPTRWK